jgi:hypothetical protein
MKRTTYLDVKEHLVQGLNNADIVKAASIYGATIDNNAPIGISDQYIVLDSLQKNRQSNPNRGLFTFDISHKSVPNDRVTLVRDSLSDLIEIEASAFYIEKPKEFQFLTTAERDSFYPKLVSTVVPGVNALKSYGDTFMIEIKELIPNAVSDPKGGWHSFIYTPSLTPSDNLFLIPINPVYNFTDVTEHISRITLHFKSENDSIYFFDDMYYDILPTFTVVGLDKYITFNIPDHNLDTDDRIHIHGFTSGDYITDRYINRKEGHIINVININTFRLNPDVDVSHLISGASFITPLLHCNISIDKRRLRIPFRFRKLVRRITNYKAP